MPLVQVTMVSGRTAEQKHALIAQVSAAPAASPPSPSADPADGEATP